ncbi:carbon-nitrogen hydrolase [Hirsutella rhossiliensis]|uniref:Carbon-nitrogen hydrolase domain-containing protein n=1 Tax=Hirsutella rhossiliensis TaxID=111463 RepID=A0A9P8N727_9HYPO|nr:carbon-nitrogen hydrolase domain-containing protein [Hirsutella rhossiliensis]KAH0966974.1 carbon-nitrogen hydrolase domain-containing protein [Hirsutella rhossiliensis]
MTTTLAAVGQICATACVKANLDQCVRLVGKAAAGGAKVLFLPEASDYIVPSAHATLDLAAPQSTSAFVLGLRAAAKQHSVAVHVGIHHAVGGQEATGMVVNRALYMDADGVVQEAATYDKLHVFDYGSLRESSTVRPGTRLTAPFDSPVGRIGSLICFDVRFAETAVALAQPGPTSPWRDRPAQILTYPSAFTLRTGEAHWETLLRARAIETQSWVVAAAQVGRHNERRASYGRSMVVDPWGTVRVRLRGASPSSGEGDEGAVGEIGFVEMDMGLTDRVRGQMPLQRRTDVYPECKNVDVEPS